MDIPKSRHLVTVFLLVFITACLSNESNNAMHVVLFKYADDELEGVAQGDEYLANIQAALSRIQAESEALAIELRGNDPILECSPYELNGRSLALHRIIVTAPDIDETNHDMIILTVNSRLDDLKRYIRRCLATHYN